MEVAPPSVKTYPCPRSAGMGLSLSVGLYQKRRSDGEADHDLAHAAGGLGQRKFTGGDDVGASLVEYALLLALIAVVAIGAIAFLGGSVNNQLNHVANAINSTSGTNP